MSASQGSICQSSHPKRVWVSFCGGGDGCACRDVPAPGRLSPLRAPSACSPLALALRDGWAGKRKYRARFARQRYRLAFSVPFPRLFSIPAKRRSGSGRSCACPLQNAVCPSRCHRCGVFGTRGAPRDAGSGWRGCVGEHRRGPGERSTAEAALCALPCLDGQVCSATPVPPRPAPRFRRVCLGKLPAPCQDVK